MSLAGRRRAQESKLFLAAILMSALILVTFSSISTVIKPSQGQRYIWSDEQTTTTTYRDEQTTTTTRTITTTTTTTATITTRATLTITSTTTTYIAQATVTTVTTSTLFAIRYTYVYSPTYTTTTTITVCVTPTRTGSPESFGLETSYMLPISVCFLGLLFLSSKRWPPSRRKRLTAHKYSRRIHED